eukprot:tig00000842_g4852.t1
MNSNQPSDGHVVDLEDVGTKFSHADAYHAFTPVECVEIGHKLLSWFDKSHRKLPWRVIGDAVDPYAVWISEIMLQQTRVETVIPYFERWLAKWPTVDALASATGEEVNAVWSGLGYYRRAKFLHEGAKYVMRECGGKLPSSVAALKRSAASYSFRFLPGVGDYTAGAIASIAFGAREAVVDGNVIRVLSRLRALPMDPKEKRSVELHWRLARALVEQHPERPGDLNQALMEFGATLCTPQSPSCSSCPLRPHCRALAETTGGAAPRTATVPPPDCSLCKGREDPAMRTVSVERYPTKVEKAKQREENVAVAILSGKDRAGTRRFLMVQRPDQGLLAGLWEFAAVVVPEKDIGAARRRAVVESLLADLGLPPIPAGAPRVELGEVIHLFSHIRQRLLVESIEVSAAFPPTGSGEGMVHVHAASSDREDEEAENAGKKRKGNSKTKGAGGKKKSGGSGAMLEPGRRAWRWTTAEEMEELGVPTVAKKVFALYTDRHGAGAGTGAAGISKPGAGKGRKRKPAPEAANEQPNITNFFQAKLQPKKLKDPA